jgi:hypothetical protein
METTHIPADDLRVGDAIIHENGEETPVRLLSRSGPTIVTNPGDADQISGHP